MAINKSFLKTTKIGDDLVVSDLNTALAEGIEILGAGDDGSDFHMSKNDKPYFLLRLSGYQAITVFVSAKVAEQTENIMDCLENYPVRKFVYDAKDAEGNIIPGEKRESNMLCMPATAASSKYKSIADKVAAIKAEKAEQTAEAIRLKAEQDAAALLQSSNTPA